MTARPTVMTEAQLLASVIERAEWTGWRVMHPRPARERDRRTGKDRYVTPVQGTWARGYPDLTMLHPAAGRIMVVELKSADGRLSPEQRDWLDWFRACGVDARVWRPDDWLSGVIAEALR